jgi:2-methylcitrate dehydratase PrpD
MKKVNIESNHDMGITEAYVRIMMNDDTIHEQKVNRPKGYPENPMTDDEFEHKFSDLVVPCIGKDKSDYLLNELHQLEYTDDISNIVGLTA